MSTPSIVIESVSVTVRDTATNQSVEYRGHLGPVSAPREAPAAPESRSTQAAREAAPAARSSKPERKPEKKDADRKKEAATTDAPKAKKAGPRKQPELKWAPVQDTGYHGFAASSGSGSFRVLRRRGSQWALFYVWRGGAFKMLGCFLSVEKAQSRAERDHRKRMPDTYEINAEVIAQACPIPAGMNDDDIEPSRPTAARRREDTGEPPSSKPAAESLAAAPEVEPTPSPKTEPPPAPTLTPEMRKEMFGSLRGVLTEVMQGADRA